MKNGHKARESVLKARGHERGQGNFRNQNHDRTAPGQAIGGKTQIDFGLSASGDPVQEHHGWMAGLDRLVDDLQRDGLLRHEGQWRRRQSDRYGALYADVVFAKLALVEICERDGVPYRAWETFDDVVRALEHLEALPGPVAPVACPGWTPLPDSPTA